MCRLPGLAMGGKSQKQPYEYDGGDKCLDGKCDEETAEEFNKKPHVGFGEDMCCNVCPYAVDQHSFLETSASAGFLQAISHLFKLQGVHACPPGAHACPIYGAILHPIGRTP